MTVEEQDARLALHIQKLRDERLLLEEKVSHLEELADEQEKIADEMERLIAQSRRIHAERELLLSA